MSSPAPATLAEIYSAHCSRPGFRFDPVQAHAVAALDSLSRTLAQPPPAQGRWQRLRMRLFPDESSVEPVCGLYLWGSVGRGKTYLMDLFYAQLPVERKLRSHFHRFMHAVHGDLRKLREQSDPLETVAEGLARRARVVCFDELFVSDIGDAMILGTLFAAMFRRGITLVATSNVPARGLYQGGLQRQRFLPAIELLEQHTASLHLAGVTDYRLRALEQAAVYYTPLDAAAERGLEECFERIAPEPGHRGLPIEVEGRAIATRRCADTVVWFDFAAICGGPRSAADYIEIARCYQSVLISDIPVLTAEADDQARRFIALVDELYDHRVKLIVSAAADLEGLYTGQRLGFEFERTRSRLREMRLHEYLAQRHEP